MTPTRATSRAALRCGANAYVTKDRLGDDLLYAIELAFTGVEFVSPMD